MSFMKKLIMILTCIFASVGLSVAQTKLVSGTVVDDTGETLIGASVVAKGTTVGVVTDLDGNFSFNIPSDNNTLVISLLGMKTKDVKAGTSLKVVLEEDSKVIDEVVVTAMGITREKKALGYASQGLSSDNLTQASNTSLSGAMQGKVSGVQITPSSGMPGASTQVTIRGARSFSGDNTPLYVVDGMPISSTADQNTGQGTSGSDYSNRAVDIDPNDIASLEILKGQAAAALYGIRASNGVVIITTKSGKGLKKGKAQVTVSSSVSFEKLTRYPKTQTRYAQGTGGEYSPYSSLSWGPLVSDLPKSSVLIDKDKPELGTYGGDNNGHPGKYYVPQLAAAGLDPWATPETHDNIKDYFKTGVTWNNSVSVAQAFDKSSYSFFLGAANQDGVIPSTGMNRYTAKLTAETKLTDQWTTGFVGTYVNTKITKAPTANNSVLAAVYGAPISYDLKNTPSYILDNPYSQNNYRTGGFDNPYWGMNNNEFSERTSRFYGNGYFNYATKLNSDNKKLNLKYQLGVDAYTTSYVDAFGYGSGAASKGQIEDYDRRNVSLNSLLVGTFNWRLNEDWNVNLVGGNEFIQEDKKYLYAYGASYNFAGWNHIKNATSTSNKTRNRNKRTVGLFGDASVSYKSMLYFGVTGRQDVVSDMPRDNRSFFYPSVNASFILSELKGLKDNGVFDYAKIRVSYAEVGQAGDYQESYYYKPEYGSGFYLGTPIIYPIGGVSGFAPYPIVYDPKLKPQNTKSYEVGFDMTFLNGLFDISYTYSRQNVNDQIFEVPLSGSTGVESILTNGGKIHTNTNEITLNVNPIRTKLIDWSLGVNWTKIDNYVDELAPGVESIFLGGFTTPQVRAGIGYKFPVIYGSDYLRKDGKIVVDSDGFPMAGENAVIGNVSPDFLLGFNTSVRINKVRIAAVFDWKSGGQMYQGTSGVMNVYGMGVDTQNRDQSFTVDGVKEDGSINNIVITPDNMEDYYNAVNSIDASSIHDNSFIKLRELSLSYTAYKTSWIEVGVNGFARNILVWTKLKNFDPESSQGNTNMGGAFERFSMPQTSSYGFGVNVKF